MTTFHDALFVTQTQTRLVVSCTFDSYYKHQLNGLLSSSKLKFFYLRPCLPWQRIVDEARKDPGGPCSKMHDLLDVISVSCGHFPSHDGCFVWICVATPEARAWQAPETRRGSLIFTHTHTHSLEALLPLFWQRVSERSDAMERVKAQWQWQWLTEKNSACSLSCCGRDVLRFPFK